MRSDIDADVVSAITDGSAYLMYERIHIDPTRVYFNNYNSGSNPPSFSQLGTPDDPVLQAVVTTYPNGKMAFFYNDGGTLKYQVQGSSTLVNTGIAIRGIPGANVQSASFFYVNSSGRVIYRDIDYDKLEAGDTNPFTTPHPGWAAASDTGVDIPSSVLACHSVYYGCVVLYEDQGGIRVKVIENTTSIFSWAEHTSPGRFMFPISVQTSGSGRSMQSLLAYSSACRTDFQTDVFVYVSNHITGGVDAMRLDRDSGNFSDVWTAVPADLKSSICEFRVNNIITSKDVMFMCGTFIRHENVENYTEYTLVLRSTDGHNWSMDRFSLISDLPYRNFLGYDYGPWPLPYKLMMGSFNRVASADATWLYDDNFYWGDPPPVRLTINHKGIASLTDDQVSQLDISLAAGSEEYFDHAYIQVGAKLTLELVYQTSSGSIATTYGTYYIDAISKGIRDGGRQLVLSCKNQSLWQLEGMTSPFYTEIISKSSVYDGLSSIDASQLYTAELSGLWEEAWSVDFWETGEPWDDTGITGVDIHEKGGVDRKELTGSHVAGIRTGDLKNSINCEEYPQFYQNNAYFEIYGWSYPASGSVNDEVKLHLWLETSSGSLYEVETAGARWPNTYPSSAAGDYPITFTVNQPIGTKIRELGLKFTNSATSFIYPCRIDCTGGTDVYYGATDANTGWYSEKDKLWKVRGKNRPYIMFSRQPYDTFNYRIAGWFTENISGYVNDLGPVGYGLVGLAQNGRNYVVARYNKVEGRLELAMMRNGTETLLASAVPTVSVSGGCYMFFSHVDGNFEIRIRDGSNGWIRQLSYSWEAADSWMFTNEIAAKHTGVYGVITVPSFRITGFDEGADTDLDRALGMPMLPGHSTLGYFPASGLVDVGENVYSYSGVIDYTDIRGPFQYRQHAQYPPPYGNGNWGMHIRDHNRGAGYSDYAGYLLASDDGTVYKVIGTLWNVFNSTHGVREQLPGRAQYYCQQGILEKAFHTMANRIYVTGGLDNCNLLRGDSAYQPWGEYCYLHTAGSIQLLAFSGSSGDYDFTLEDLVTRLAASAGAVAQFPGDITFTGPNPWVAGTWYPVGSYDYADCFELRFRTNNMNSGNYFDVRTNIPIDNDDTGVIVRFQYSSGSAVVQLRLQPSDTVYSSWAVPDFNMQATDIRLMFHKQFATVYMDGRWMHTFHLTNAIYPTTVEIEMRSSAGGTMGNVYLQEMPEWREAIYIDLETDGTAAIQAVIQERPVEIYPRWDGSIAFWYDPIRSTVTQSVKPREHTWQERIPTGAASDAIIYYSEVKTIQHEAFRDNYGFSTKVYRMPNLEAGAIRAAKITLDREYSKRRTHTVAIRPDVRIEPGDKLSVSYNRTGSGVATSFTMIVDSMKLTQEASNSQMIIDGREV